ncbi:MAG: NAD(P)-dependent oxidoreductase [Acidobacteria bacterium]|nr:NAD(P)-dependent oxidoreductase [Acidobacteriota bacterium]
MDLSQGPIGIVGLGRMGSGIARNLLTKGFRLRVWDLDPTARSRFERAVTASHLDDLLESSEGILLSLPGSPEVETVVGRGLELGVKGKTILDFSTSMPDSSRRLHDRVKTAGGDFLETPVTGNPTHAEAGTLRIIVSGDRRVYTRWLKVLEAVSERTIFVGEPGAATTIKLATNYLGILYVALYAEILTVVQKTGVDPAAFIEVVSASGPNCPLFQHVAPKIVCDRYEMAFGLRLAMKDLAYVKSLFEEQQMPSLLLDAGLNLYRIAAAKGLQGDLSEVAIPLKEIAGLRQAHPSR